MVFMDPRVFAQMESYLETISGVEEHIDEEEVKAHEAKRAALQEKFDSGEDTTLRSALRLLRMYTSQGPEGFKKDINKGYRILLSIKEAFPGNEYAVLAQELRLEGTRMFYSSEHGSRDTATSSYLACCRRVLNIPDEEFADSTRELETEEDEAKFLADVTRLKDGVRERLMTLSTAGGYSPRTRIELTKIVSEVPNDQEIHSWAEEELRKVMTATAEGEESELGVEHQE